MPPIDRVDKPAKLKLLDTPTILLLLGAAAYLYCFLFAWPLLPIESSDLGDSILYIASPLRMLQGEVMYRDFFEFVAPGYAMLCLAFFKLFGVRYWIPNLLVMILGIGQVWLGYSIAKKLMRPAIAWLPSAIFLVCVRPALMDPTHNWFSMFAAVAGIAVLIDCRTLARIAVAGALCGVSATFTQTRGLIVVFGFAAFLWWESRRQKDSARDLLKREATLFAGFVLAFIALNAYFIWTAGPAQYFWSTVVFVLKYYPKQADWNTLQSLKTYFPVYTHLRATILDAAGWSFAFVLGPLIYVLFLIHWCEARKKPLGYWARPMLVAMVGIFMVLGIAPAPSPMRLDTCVLPPLILLVWLVDTRARFARPLLVGLTVLSVFAGVRGLLKDRPVPEGVLKTEAGQMAIPDAYLLEEDAWIESHTKPLDYFYEADFPDVYFYLNLRNPTPLPRIVSNGYTTVEQVQQAIHGLQQHRTEYILWRANDLDVLPAWEQPSGDNLGPLRDYLHSHYHRVKVFSDADEIWEKNLE
jgi:hypothetical protein